MGKQSENIKHSHLRSSDSGVTPVGQSCDDGRGCGDESETSHLCAWVEGVSGQYLIWVVIGYLGGIWVWGVDCSRPVGLSPERW